MGSAGSLRSLPFYSTFGLPAGAVLAAARFDLERRGSVFRPLRVPDWRDTSAAARFPELLQDLLRTTGLPDHAPVFPGFVCRLGGDAGWTGRTITGLELAAVQLNSFLVLCPVSPKLFHARSWRLWRKCAGGNMVSGHRRTVLPAISMARSMRSQAPVAVYSTRLYLSGPNLPNPLLPVPPYSTSGWFLSYAQPARCPGAWSIGGIRNSL